MLPRVVNHKTKIFLNFFGKGVDKPATLIIMETRRWWSKMVSLKKKELEKFMDERGLSYCRLAKELGYSKSYISKVKNGRLRPSINFITKLKRYSGLSVEHFFNFDEEVKEE